MDNVTSFLIFISKSLKDDYVVLPNYYGLNTYWTRSPVPEGYNVMKEYQIFKEWGGVDWNWNENVYFRYEVSKQVRMETLSKVLVIADRLAKDGDDQARTYPIDYYIRLYG
ncbi:hypothetical protein M441DRAFT_63106 [Trichoderma asperellum CBS 433.97]|uniref:Uncharacterized protein n=1 Tax=Trichoderma asperellum (strain ATCC 204424 / CBS 433.97 / NBRC 101777) TaxID=1042311 RepID=A0A2T3YQS7_TRIA4|nr:hypothetical protein M441DRAFT_63106 [Trichoderma asperellum CBS 433.97]PTB34922.1 hypothetical protein M441DRAFT_63106 [Trichoderma asperellum CBS 433.97]